MSTEEELTTLRELRECKASSLREHIPELLARDTPLYLVEYGIRIDDGALVFHFFPPKEEADWPPNNRMNKRLEHALDSLVDVKTVAVADYIQELRSFCIILRGLGHSPDPWIFVERFFAKIDEPLPGQN